MCRRLVLLLFLLHTCSSFVEKKKEPTTCSAARKDSCGGGTEKKVVKAKISSSLNFIDAVSKKKEPNKGHYYDKEGQFDGKVAKAVLAKLEAKPRVLEEKCSQLTGVCYEVVDIVWRNPDGYTSNAWEMLRQVQLKGQRQFHFGRVTLIKPSVLNWKTYDTKNWKVNKYAVIDREIQTMIGGLTGSLAIPQSEKNATREYYILLVGLGTPMIPLYLEQFHWMKILVLDKEPLFQYFAKKWFELILTPNLRIMTVDPISFMSFMVTNDVQYDALLVNVCKDEASISPCPADVYLERSTVEVMKKVVEKETGMLSVNTRTADKTHEKTVANSYGNIFPMCFSYPGEHKQLNFERYKSTVCYNREHEPFWQTNEKEYMINSHQDWFYYV